MRVPNFDIQNQRSIRWAACTSVPTLMVIAGPNGAGKSTLLHAIRTSHRFNNIMYVAPHRAMRRQQVQQKFLMTTPISIESVLTNQSVPNYEGIRIVEGSREPWSSDDSANYLKYALCQIEFERAQAIARRYDRDGQIPSNALADPWKPLRELTHNLLPHLEFVKIDTTDRSQIKCMWNVHSKNTLVDLDELSSGEKSIIQMFYPLLERETKALLAEVESGPTPHEKPDVCVLIDEPELHLHPNLQLKVFDYLRVLTTGERVHVIVATHSPTMVEHASFEELFLLRPVELVKDGENQLVRVASDEERLRFLRDVFGTTSNLTAMQPVIVVEGVSEKEASNVSVRPNHPCRAW